MKWKELTKIFMMIVKTLWSPWSVQKYISVKSPVGLPLASRGRCNMIYFTIHLSGNYLAQFSPYARAQKWHKATLVLVVLVTRIITNMQLVFLEDKRAKLLYQSEIVKRKYRVHRNVGLIYNFYTLYNHLYNIIICTAYDGEWYLPVCWNGTAMVILVGHMNRAVPFQQGFLWPCAWYWSTQVGSFFFVYSTLNLAVIQKVQNRSHK